MPTKITVKVLTPIDLRKALPRTQPRDRYESKD